MEQIMLASFILLVALVALCRTIQDAPHHHGAEKLYAPPVSPMRAVSLPDSSDVRSPALRMVAGGKEGWTGQEAEAVRRAA